MKYKGLKIMFCIPGASFSSHFLNCWDLLTRFMNEEGIQYGLNTGYVPIINLARDQVLGINPHAEIKIPFDGKIIYDYIMWIDSDTIFAPEQFKNLLDSKVQVVSGYCTMLNNKGKHTYAVVKNGKHINQKVIQDFLDEIDCGCNTIMKVDKPTLAFCLIEKKVMDKLTYPYFDIEYKNGTWKGEDYYFFDKITKAGFNMHIHTASRVGHLKQQIF
jgi:hypothetical protein|tara:strand:- start:12 stop:659 length:648 start_codon:yes stop_codon:yes gene_type:complete